MIRDIIRYENLIPGESYTARGKLMMKEANKPFTVLGKEVESQATFVASDSGTGHVTMDFVFNRKLLSNDLTLVVFEKVFDAKGKVIGVHEDINDEAQTVKVKPYNEEEPPSKENPPTTTTGGGTPKLTTTPSKSYGGGSSGSSLPQTGEEMIEILPYIGLVVLSGVGAAYIYRKKKVS